MYKDAPQVNKFKRLLIFPVFVEDIYYLLSGKTKFKQMNSQMHIFGRQNDKRLAKMDSDCYLIQVVLCLQVYCKPLIMGNT